MLYNAGSVGSPGRIMACWHACKSRRRNTHKVGTPMIGCGPTARWGRAKGSGIGYQAIQVAARPEPQPAPPSRFCGTSRMHLFAARAQSPLSDHDISGEGLGLTSGIFSRKHPVGRISHPEICRLSRLGFAVRPFPRAETSQIRMWSQSLWALSSHLSNFLQQLDDEGSNERAASANERCHGVTLHDLRQFVCPHPTRRARGYLFSLWLRGIPRLAEAE